KGVEGGEGNDKGVRDPGQSDGGRDLPEGRREGERERDRREGVGAVRDVERRPEDAQEVRVPTAVRRRRRRPSVVVAVLAAVAVAFFVGPLIGLLQRAPWSE